MKSFSNEDNHMAHIWWKKKNSSISSRSSDSQFVLVRAGLAQAVGWKIMVIWWSVRDSGSLTSSSMCAKWISSLENHFMLNIWSHLKKKIWHLVHTQERNSEENNSPYKTLQTLLHWKAYSTDFSVNFRYLVATKSIPTSLFWKGIFYQIGW